MYLGDRVKDLITGFTGVIVCYSIHEFNTDTVSVQSDTLDAEGLPKKPQQFDITQLQLVERGVINYKLSLPNKFNIGDLVKHAHTKFKGRVTCKTVWINGCNRITVVPVDLDKDGKVREEGWGSDLEWVLVKAAKPKEPVKHKTGGPMPAQRRF